MYKEIVKNGKNIWCWILNTPLVTWVELETWTIQGEAQFYWLATNNSWEEFVEANNLENTPVTIYVEEDLINANEFDFNYEVTVSIDNYPQHIISSFNHFINNKWDKLSYSTIYELYDQRCLCCDYEPTT